MRRIGLALTVVLLAASTASAQWVVNDPAVTAKNAAVALLQQYLLNTQTLERQLFDRMSKRLSAVARLDRYVLPDVPVWRLPVVPYPSSSPVTPALEGALAVGDPSGGSWTRATDVLEAATLLMTRLSPAARRAALARLTTVDVADALAIAALDNAGQIRANGRRELAAINGLETDVIDPNPDQSVTAVLDKVSGSALIGARQRQARIQLLSGVLEQLLMDNKRARDSEAATLNMQMVQWQAGRAANDAFVAGTGDALRTWRQR